MTKQIKLDLSIGKCEEVLKDFPDNHFDSIITDPPYGLGNEPDPIELLRSWVHETEVKAGSGGFMGHCYHPDTEVRTKVGWKPISLVREGDLILSRPPTPARSETEWVSAVKTFKYEYEGPMIHISGNSVAQIVTPNHNVWCPVTGKLVRADSLGTSMQQAGHEVQDICTVSTSPYRGKVYCCQLERNHVLLTRINGKTAWSGNSWDATVPSPAQFREILRVVKPGKKSAFFAGTRTLHLMVASLRLAGFQIEDVWAWCYGCFDEETEVFVGGKWVSCDTLRVGQTIRAFTEDGRFVETPIQQVINLPDYDDIAYRLVGKDVDQLVSHNHRVVVWDEESETYTHKVVDALCGGGYVQVPVVTTSGLHHEEVLVRHVESYQRPMWCVRVATGMVVIRRNGKISVSGNSGFPKSMNVHKALKKKVKARYGEARCQCVGDDYEYEEAIFAPEGVIDFERESQRVLILDDYADHDLVTRVCSWCAQPDQGFIDSTQGLGTSLKPAFEPAVIVSKPEVATEIDLNAILESYGFSEEEIRAIMTPPEK